MEERFIEKDIGAGVFEDIKKKVIDTLGSDHPIITETLRILKEKQRINCASVKNILEALEGLENVGEVMDDIRFHQNNIRLNQKIRKKLTNNEPPNLIIIDALRAKFKLNATSIGLLLHSCERSENLNLEKLFELLDRNIETVHTAHLNTILHCVLNSDTPRKYNINLEKHRNAILDCNADLEGSSIATILQVSWFLNDLGDVHGSRKLRSQYNSYHLRNCSPEDKLTQQTFIKLQEAISQEGYTLGNVAKEHLLPGISTDRMMLVNETPLYFEWDGLDYHRDKENNKWNTKTISQRRLLDYKEIPLLYLSQRDWNTDSEEFNSRFLGILKKFLAENIPQEEGIDLNPFNLSSQPL